MMIFLKITEHEDCLTIEAAAHGEVYIDDGGAYRRSKLYNETVTYYPYDPIDGSDSFTRDRDKIISIANKIQTYAMELMEQSGG